MPQPNPPATPGDFPMDAKPGISFEAVYDRLKVLAHGQLSGGRGNTLNTTALVHELYLRMGNEGVGPGPPAHYFAYAARAMRNLLINRARDRMRQKAGGDWVRIATLSGEGDPAFAIDSAEQALAIHDALVQLEKSDPRAARVFELRFFAGLGADQIGDLLDVTRRTVDRDWRFARAFLLALLDA